MNEKEVRVLKETLGPVSVGDKVLYVKDGNVSTIGEAYKKDIWIVEKVVAEKAQIRNYVESNNVFTTNMTNLVPVHRLIGVFGIIKFLCFLTRASKSKYSRIENKNACSDKYDVDSYDSYKGRKEKYGRCKAKMINNAIVDNNGDIEKETGDVTMMSKMIADNSKAARNGAVLSAGRTLNKVVANTVRDRVPRKYRKLLDTPVADIVIANVANVAVQNFAANNPRARIATSAMMEAAMAGFFDSFNISDIINDTLKNVDLDALLNATED